MIRFDKIFASRAGNPDPLPGEPGPAPLPDAADDMTFADRLRRAIAVPEPTNDPTPQPIPPGQAGMRPGQALADDRLPGAGLPDSPPPRPENPHSVDQPTAIVPPADSASAAKPVPLLLIDPGPDTVPATPPVPERRAGRVRTRLLGHDHVQNLVSDPISDARAAQIAPQGRFPVGWIVVTQGPGKGSFFTLFNGVSQIGRGPDQSVRLDFGDTSISRINHAAIAYDDATNEFFLGHGGKANLVRLNNRPVVSTEPLAHLDTIRIGETTLRFVALCKDDFRWDFTTLAEESFD